MREPEEPVCGELFAAFERASAVSRRQLLRRGAVAVGGMSGAGVFGTSLAFAASHPAPRPIPGGFDKNFKPVPKHPLVHVLSPGIGFEMSTITDFNGVVAGS